MSAKRRLRLRLVEDDALPTLTPARVHALASDLRADPDAALVILEGRPGRFCEGLDPSVHVSRVVLELGRFATLIAALQTTPRPVVALVDGPALGGGAGLAAAADLVIASRRASFALPESLLGLIPAVVFPLLVQRMGVSRARLMALGAPPLTADEALQAGLADVITDDVSIACERYAARFARMDSRALGHVKALAAYYRPPPGLRRAAVERFAALWRSRRTRQRLARVVAGRAPWGDEAQES